MERTFYHEFRHLMPQNARFIGGNINQNNPEKDADRWAEKFLDSSCNCGFTKTFID